MAAPTTHDFNTAYARAHAKLAVSATVRTGTTPDFRDHSDLTLWTTPVSWMYWPLYWFQPTDRLPMVHFREGANQTGDINQKWLDAGTGLFIAPSVLIVLGILAGVLVLCCVCGAQRPSGKITVKPGRRQLRRLSWLSIAVLWIFGMASSSKGIYFLMQIDMKLGRIAPDIYFIRDKLDDLQPRVHNAAVWLQGWQTSCAGWSFLKPHVSKSLLKENNHYMKVIRNKSFAVYNAQQLYQPIPRMFRKIKQDWIHPLATKWWMLFGIGILPAIFPTMIIISILRMAANDDAEQDEAHVEVIVKRLRRFGICPLVICMQVMILVSAVFLFPATGLGLYCANPEENMVNMVSAFVGNGNRTANGSTLLVAYYLTGNPPSNPMVETLRSARSDMQLVNDNLFILKPALDILGVLCGRIGFANPASLVLDAVAIIDRLLPFTLRDHMYGIFDDLVNEGMCGHLISSMGWWIASQVFAALFVLPYLTYLLNKHLLEHEGWLLYVEEQRVSRAEEEEQRQRLLNEQSIKMQQREATQRNQCSIS